MFDDDKAIDIKYSSYNSGNIKLLDFGNQAGIGIKVAYSITDGKCPETIKDILKADILGKTGFTYMADSDTWILHIGTTATDLRSRNIREEAQKRFTQLCEEMKRIDEQQQTNIPRILDSTQSKTLFKTNEPSR